jgi:hypothetical protein
MKQYLILAVIVVFNSCKSGEKEKQESPVKYDSIITAAPVTQIDKIDIENFGDIKIGQPHVKTIETLGQPDSKSPAVEWGVDGLMHEDLIYTAKELKLDMTSAKGTSDGTKYVSSITASTNCTFKTKAGMGIGNSYTEVQEAYKRDIDATATDKEQITIGSIYG